MSIHPCAVVSGEARLGSGVSVGPFAVVEPGAEVGENCEVGARCTVKGGVTLGPDNILEEGVVLGGRPQHLMRIPNPGPVVVGRGNVFRENCTVHRAMKPDGETRIGDGCLIMVGAHVAHDCRLGNQVVLTNNVMLAGHVVVGDRAYLGGGAAVHQFCRIGRLAMVGGMARVPQDIPPFLMIDGATGMAVGLNRVGLRRAGMTSEEVAQIKEAYRVIFRSGLSFEERLETLQALFPSGPASEFAAFFREGQRGFVRERRLPPSASIHPIHDDLADQEDTQRPSLRRVG